MKIAVIDNDKIVVKNAENIKLSGRKGAIVKVLGSGLCGSDIVKFREHISGNGTVLGHEIVAQIEEINSDTAFKTGDRIVTSHHIPCGKCNYCKHGNVSMCEHFKSTNIKPGGFSEYVYLSEEHLENVAHLIPSNLTEIEASFYEPLGCCVRAVKRANLMKNSTVLVVGLGSIGILMAQALKAFGMEVTGCDLIAERIEFLKTLGIEAFDSRELSNNEEFDAVFMTSGADKAVDVALKNIRSGGTILVFSSTPLNTGYGNNEIYYRELTVLGSYSPSPADLQDSLELLRDGKVIVKNMSTVYMLDDIQKAFDDTISNKIMKAYIKIKD
ncbi:TPA: alcohol dehydrogenase catalytic domain-containing protein [Candidatus Scatousia excrementigallinarum]|uniref:Alcohol dehydrogenase catalytic domain-containing protein n=1 Tax=Candidatus Scatousia excrementigallinarum TaxID=2840935 RepID=A0A9D1EWG3_9BACT|nr:alcohol dehydrogenase catalytic domain-containing protein [Candidatus Scatousia excrementigallinarum]